MNIQKRHLLYLLIAVIDMMVILFSYFLASYIYLGDPLAPNQLVSVKMFSWRVSAMLFLSAYSFLLVLGYAISGVFGSIYVGNIRKMAKSVCLVNIIGVVVFASSFYVLNLDDASRILVLLYFVLSTLGVWSANWMFISLFRIRRSSQKFRRNVLVVGCGELAKEYAQAVRARSSRHEHVIGYIRPYEIDTEMEHDDCLGPCLGWVNDLDSVFESREIEEIVLALNVEDYVCVRSAISAADRHGVALTLVPFYNDIIPKKPNIDSFGGVNLVDLRSMPLSNPLYAVIKRAFDIVVSLVVIVLTSGIMVLTAIGVKASSPGPVFFKQTRLGRYNKTFEMLKFRSMRVNNDSDIAWSTNEDPRKTRFGSFIRKYSIDELPQFFNVLKGDMSIVGPRPEIPYYVQQFRDSIPLYMLRHQVRPGITGLAQVSGLRGDTSISKRIELDIRYIEDWTFWLDVRIFFKTLFGGFVNDESLVDSSLSKKVDGTKFGERYLALRKSADGGKLAKVFNVAYIAAALIYVFFNIYLYSSSEIVEGVTFNIARVAIACDILFLMCLGIFLCLCEARTLLFWLIAILSCVLCALIAWNSQSLQIMGIFGFVFFYPKTLKIDTLAKSLCVGIGFSILVLLASCVIGVSPNNVISGNGQLKYSMGFITPNAFASTVVVCMIPLVYIRINEWRWYDIAGCLVVGIVVFYTTRSRMALTMVCILVLVASLYRFKTVKNLLLYLAPWIALGCFAAMMFITFVYWQSPETPASSALDNLLSGRFGRIALYYGSYGITLFGQPVSFATEIISQNSMWESVVDCSYVNIFFGFGIVGSAVLILPTIWMGKRVRERHLTRMAFLVVVLALFSLTENFYYNPVQNLGIFAMGYFVAGWATRKNAPASVETLLFPE